MRESTLRAALNFWVDGLATLPLSLEGSHGWRRACCGCRSVNLRTGNRDGQEAFKHGDDLRMRPIAWPDDLVNEQPPFIDNKALGHPTGVVEMGNPVLRVEQGRESQLVFLHEGGNDLGPQGINTDRQDFQTTIMEPLVQPLHGRHFLDTGRAPGRPNVDEHHLAA